MSNLPITPNPDTDLVIERVVDVPVDKVYAAWTTPDSIKQWFAPKPFETTECEIDLRPGGAFHTVMKSPDGELYPNDGCYLEIVPNERLVWTSALAPGFRPKAEEFLPFTAVLLLEAVGENQTKYTAIAIHGDAETTKRHEEMGFFDGWGQVIDQLVAHIQAG